MGNFAQDIRYAFRVLTANRAFALAAVLSLAIGIGANTALFSVVNGLLLRPLPYKNADRLAILWNRSPGLNITQDWFSTAQFFDIRDGHHGFEQLAIAIGANTNITGDGEPERVATIRVSSNLLPMLGATPAYGRSFITAEDAPGRAPTAVLSYGFWSRRYGSDPHIVGRSINLNGVSCEVVGVLPRSFSLPYEVLPTLGGSETADILLPLPLSPAAPRIRTREDYNILALLKPGVRLEQARAEMETITARLRRDFPELYPPNGGLTFSIVPLLEQVVGDVRRPLYILLAAVGLVLLVACANVANLLLARGLARQRELALRAAFGADRSRLVRQLLTESILLSLAGGAVGILLAVWSLSWLRMLGPDSIPRLAGISLDGRVLLFTLFVSIFTGVLFGLAPALRISRVDLNSVIKESGRGSAGGHNVWGRGSNLRRLLVVGELALSLLLLIGAGLLLRSFAHLQAVPPGFNPNHLLTFSLTMSGRQYNDGQKVLAAYHDLWQRVERLPGVTAAGGTYVLPFTSFFAWTPIVVEGRTPPPGEKFLYADARTIAGGYFQAMEIPLRAGRFFDEHDTNTNPRVTIVDEHMARQFWPGQEPLGKRIHQVESGPEGPWLTIVGVVGRVKHTAMDTDPRIVFYLPHTQSPTRALVAVVRANGDAGKLTSAVKSEIRALDRDLPIYRMRTMSDIVEQSLAPRHFSTLLLAIFAGLALALAAIGIYGVIAYLVNQGTREIGIRIALGATSRSILTLVVRQGMTLAVTGVAIGLASAFALTRFLGSLLFGVRPTDPLTFTALPLLLLSVALLASYIPARAATRIDPITYLRE